MARSLFHILGSNESDLSSTVNQKENPLSLGPTKISTKAVVGRGRLHSRLGDALVVVVALVLVNLPQRRVVLLALENGKQALGRME